MIEFALYIYTFHSDVELILNRQTVLTTKNFRFDWSGQKSEILFMWIHFIYAGWNTPKKRKRIAETKRNNNNDIKKYNIFFTLCWVNIICSTRYMHSYCVHIPSVLFHVDVYNERSVADRWINNLIVYSSNYMWYHRFRTHILFLLFACHIISLKLLCLFPVLVEL